ncbi:hypothetical protein bAD24_III10690 [Burkholderia sp. AD24]|nr:hypothetical protein bAD24_III10690 [Burkholderia sp. AD24]
MLYRSSPQDRAGPPEPLCGKRRQERVLVREVVIGSGLRHAQLTGEQPQAQFSRSVFLQQLKRALN